VAAIIAMGHALGVTIVAEGVETEAQADELGLLACDVGQGHRLGRAEDREATDKLLRSGRLALSAGGA
jgi:EAL domain-containing protein (putative c-di-GMP-specific phosphodiesterase class I)